MAPHGRYEPAEMGPLSVVVSVVLFDCEWMTLCVGKPRTNSRIVVNSYTSVGTSISSSTSDTVWCVPHDSFGRGSCSFATTSRASYVERKVAELLVKAYLGLWNGADINGTALRRLMRIAPLPALTFLPACQGILAATIYIVAAKIPWRSDQQKVFDELKRLCVKQLLNRCILLISVNPSIFLLIRLVLHTQRFFLRRMQR